MTTHKALGAVDLRVKSVKGAAGFGEWESVLSAPTLDRDGEIIDAGAFNPLPERIPIDIDHSMTVAGTIGSGVPFYDGKLLKIRGEFASTDLAQQVRTLVREGHINRMSVTFAAATREKGGDGTVHIRSAELLNAAFVPIPSNREAMVLAAKGRGYGRRTAADKVRALVALAEAELLVSDAGRVLGTSSKQLAQQDPRRVLSEAQDLLRYLGGHR